MFSNFVCRRLSWTWWAVRIKFCSYKCNQNCRTWENKKRSIIVLFGFDFDGVGKSYNVFKFNCNMYSLISLNIFASHARAWVALYGCRVIIHSFTRNLRLRIVIRLRSLPLRNADVNFLDCLLDKSSNSKNAKPIIAWTGTYFRQQPCRGS